MQGLALLALAAHSKKGRRMLKKVMCEIAVILLPMAFVGCATLSDTKSLSITPQPGETRVVVDTNAVTRCTDIFFVISCKLEHELHQAGGATTFSHSDPSVPSGDTSMPNTASSRLGQLDELREKGLITEKEYQEKRQKILKGL
jgi:hypothetical protein